MSASGSASADTAIAGSDLTYVAYTGEMFLQGIIDLISVDLSEPYSVFTYRYFINNWPNLCYLAVVPAKAEADAEGPAREARRRVWGLGISIPVSKLYNSICFLRILIVWGNPNMDLNGILEN